MQEKYLKFEGPIDGNTPKELIPLLYTIKSKITWESLGFKIKSDQHGNYKPFSKKGVWFRFREILSFKDIEIKAFYEQKKYATDPITVLSLLERGCSYDDFVVIGNDIKHFYESYKHYENKEFELALKKINEALQLKPSEHQYKELYFNINFELKNHAVIDEEIMYNMSIYKGISSMTHCRKIDKWVKILIGLKEYKKVIQVIEKINVCFEKEISINNGFINSELLYVNGSKEMGKEFQKNAYENKLNYIRSERELFNNRMLKFKERALKNLK